ncbi:arylsulfatase [Endozoicomonas lisbonensis]|uniref:Arylsulfatase A-like enzyme n=1 Tax=Endozoicomonas lisbonensis TaxID=3120522 RepID=A0ABV2SD67_9GAMM
MKKLFKRTALAATMAGAALAGTGAHAAPAPSAEKPNILVIMADDVGYWNLSTYHQGMMGYDTPNIDRIAQEGALFTDWYAQQSSTAGRSAFVLGQMPYRTGLTKVGMPGADRGISEEDPTMAQMLRDLGYTTGQFGKNHLGDRDEFLPTNHGFDEFFGNLYHLNAEEEPEMPDYPDTVARPRGVIRSSADGKIEDTGPLTRKRMETVDAEFLGATKEFIEGAVKEDKPFFAWFNPSRMHHFTHLSEKYEGISGNGLYADGMRELDDYVGELLDQLEELGVDDNTIVMFTTDNGFQLMAWPDAGMSPFRGEKNTGWEGGFRVPALMKWPGTIEPGSRFGDIVSHEDMFPTLLSAAGNPNIKQQLLDGYKSSNGKEYNVHLDGYDMTNYFAGKEEKGPRDQFWYFSDDGDLLAVRNERFKIHFMIQEAENGQDVWRRPFTRLRGPRMYDLKIDPFERADKGWGYEEWYQKRLYHMFDIMGKMQPTIESFAEYPQRMTPASFTIDDALEAMNRMNQMSVNR